MQTELYKRQIVIVVIIAIVAIVAMAIVFHNSSIQNETPPPGWLLFFLLFIGVFSLGYVINIANKALNPKILQNLIDAKIAVERSRILKEFEKKKEKENDKSENLLVLQEKIKGVIPKGNFKNVDSFIEKLLKNIAANLEMVQGIAYLKEKDSENYNFLKGYGLTNEDETFSFKSGENLNGQAVENKEIMIIDEIPENYFSVESGLGQARPKQIIIVPVLVKNEVVAVLEMGSFKQQEELEQLMGIMNNEVSTKLEQIIKS